jgi:hypothetical protein
MALVFAVLLGLLTAAQGLAQDVTFKCKIMDSDNSTVSVSAINLGHNSMNCRATCTVTGVDSRARSLTFSGSVPPMTIVGLSPRHDHHAVGRFRGCVTTNQAIILALWDEDTLDAGILGFLCEFCQARET